VPSSPDESDTTGTLSIERVAPGLFTANSNGSGVASAIALRAKQGGAQTLESVIQYDGSKFVPAPIDLGPASDQVFLLLFGAGIRNNSGLANVSVSVGGTPCPVQFAGPQGGFVGLDHSGILFGRFERICDRKSAQISTVASAFHRRRQAWRLLNI
jgi:uncharacterized protein (TIGR03437 family)